MKFLRSLNEAAYTGGRVNPHLKKAIEDAFEGNCTNQTNPEGIKHWASIMKDLPTFDIDELVMDGVVTPEEYISALKLFTNNKLRDL